MIILGVILIVIGLFAPPQARILTPIGCLLIAVALILLVINQGVYTYY